MKRLVILLATVCAAVSLMLYCAESDFKYDNPLDEKGSNFEPKTLAGWDDMTPRQRDSIMGLWYDTTVNHIWQCDRVVPTITLRGGGTANAVSITENRPDSFNIWMGTSEASLTWVGERVSVTAILTRGGPGSGEVPRSDYQANGVPLPGHYIIVYTARKPACPDGFLPEDIKSRSLTIIKYEEDITAKPVISLRGDAAATVTVNSAEGYVDLGVAAVVDVDGTTPLALTRIRVLDSNRNLVAGGLIESSGGGVPEQINAAMVREASRRVTPINTVGAVYYLEFFVKSPVNDSTDTKTRTVTVDPGSGVLPTPVIVLNTYQHSFGGRNFRHADTAIVGTGNDLNTLRSRYIEKGVAEVYYINRQTGQRVPLSAAAVTATPLPTGPNPVGRRTITYTIAAGTDHTSASITRNVYLHDRGGCDTPLPAVNVTFQDGATISVSAATGNWRPGGAQTAAPGRWNVTSAPGYSTYLYLVDYGALNPDNLVPGGPHQVLHVGLDECGTTGTNTRSVTVIP